MTAYYVCSADIANMHCKGMHYLHIHFAASLEKRNTIYYGKTRWPDYIDATLLTNVDPKLCTLLALVDPLFRRIELADAGSDLRQMMCRRGQRSKWLTVP